MRQNRIKQILNQQDWITDVAVINQSHLHNHHDQSPGTGESHYLVKVKLNVDEKLLITHRKILQLLDKEFKMGLHSVSISVVPITKT